MEVDHRNAGSRSADGDSRFTSTNWSIVLAAGHRSSSDSDEALESLCRTYWYPLYAFVRRRGYLADDAQDLTQEFFARLIEKDYLKAADRDRGRFRSFLLTVFKRFLSKERERAMAQKRGAGRKPLSIDFTSGEDRYLLEPSHEWTAEKVYERRWALTLLDQVLNRLSREYTEREKTRVFEHLKVYLTGNSGAPAYAETAAQLGMSESAVKVAVHRVRKRYRELLKDEVGHTVTSSDDVDDELNQLLSGLRRERP